MNIVHSLWISKLRYGLQLCTKVQIKNEDSKLATMKDLQLTQNRMLRAINNTKIKDKVSIQSMLEKFDLLSVNQLAATIKLQEVWKSVNVPGCPIEMDPYKKTANLRHDLRPKNEKTFNDISRLGVSQSSFNIDAAKIWNAAPIEIRNSISISEAKRHIKSFVKTLPI